MAQLASATSTRLDVTLPVLKMDAKYELGPALQGMGVRRAFADTAEFSGITDAANLCISAVIQKTFLAIDEMGTEAAAVTAVDVVATSGLIGPPPPPPIEFKADHPFFVVLHHIPTRTRLFLGRVAQV